MVSPIQNHEFNHQMLITAAIVIRLLQKYERIEYVGDWAAQYHVPELVGRPGQGVHLRFFKDASDPAEASLI